LGREVPYAGQVLDGGQGCVTFTTGVAVVKVWLTGGECIKGQTDSVSFLSFFARTTAAVFFADNRRRKKTLGECAIRRFKRRITRV